MKIIGYLAPIDMFNGAIKKDTIYKIRNNITLYAYPDIDICSEDYAIPVEIVEMWKPRYEECEVGDIVWTSSPNTSKELLCKKTGLVGKLLEISDTFSSPYKVSVNELTYNGSGDSSPKYVWCHSIRKADNKEIKRYNFEVLLNEAKKKYHIGTVYYCASSGNEFIVESLDWLVDNVADDHVYGENCKGCLYCKGKWAKIADVNTIEVNDYKIQLFDDSVKFGCAEFDKEFFLDLYELATKQYAKTNRHIQTIKIGQGIFTFYDIKLIAQHYIKLDERS